MSERWRSQLGRRLAACRILANLTQKQVAGAVATDERTVARWEAGATEPTASKLMVLAKLFCVTSDYLLGLDAPAMAGRLMVCDEQLAALEAAVDCGQTLRDLDQKLIRPMTFDVSWRLPGPVRVTSGSAMRDVEQRIEACQKKLGLP